MLNESTQGLARFVTSLKVAALVVVLGSVVLAAEQRLATVDLPGQPIAAGTAPASRAAPDGGAQPTATDYFPARFPAPSGTDAEQPPTF